MAPQWTLVAAGVLVVTAGARTFLAEPLTVSSDSMAPTLLRGDTVVVQKVGDPARGDLVAFHSPVDGELTLKRVVGLPGDRVEIRDAELYVNGRHRSESYVDHASIDGTWYGPVTVPRQTVFVLGDRRAGSVDSRAHGPVPAGDLIGTALVRVWPPVRP